ncbi:hypothetical protein PHMEG_00020436 [Phytophthora megakarya]|uniref:Reverse transcriptase/retrotransposon-derived protein RNase H-like domain-containing protein n=1 Tax=Phytophthora megakarya TaxID=4795 RepID=A0A225VP41_9STRA|nr:hypothetical protein PHMEG_00020436 [Phytophthora megakarya]
MISADGVRNYPYRVEGHVNLPAPRTAVPVRGNLDAWKYPRVQRHYSKFSAAAVAQSRKKSRLHRVLLNSVGWTAEHDAALAHVKDALRKMVTLAHPKEEWETHFGTVVTQIPPADVGLPVHEQRHQPLAFLSGSFVGSMPYRPTIAKEALSSVISCNRLMYLLPHPVDFDFLVIIATSRTFLIRWRSTADSDSTKWIDCTGGQ